MGGDNEKTTSWGTGIEQITIGFVRYTLKPHLVRWEEELNRKLFPTRRAVRSSSRFPVCCAATPRLKPTTTRLRLVVRAPGLAGCRSTKSGPCRNLAPIDGADKPFYPDTGKTNAKESTPQPA